MEKLSEIMTKTHIGEVYKEAYKPKRDYKKGVADLMEDEYYVPPQARFKMKIWYINGHNQSYYSYDDRKIAGGITMWDEFMGLQRLIELADERAGTYKAACIWLTTAVPAWTTAGSGKTSNYNIEVGILTSKRREWNHSISAKPVDKGTHKDNRVNLQLVDTTWKWRRYSRKNKKR